MSFAQFHLPKATNEPVKSYAPGAPETKELKAAIQNYMSNVDDVPMIIGGKEVRNADKKTINPPHHRNKTVGHFYRGTEADMSSAINAAMAAKNDWQNMPWEHRAGIFLKAADLLTTTYRYRMNAATMVGQSKNAFQAEIDSACELIDFIRYNVEFANQIYNGQPESSAGVWNRMEYRPLEGFVLAVTPFNFTAIAGNLPSSAALMGNTVVWKPSDKQMLSAHVILDLFKEAGLPDGVINMVSAPGRTVGQVAFNHRDFGGVHFTGSTGVFNDMWKQIGNNMNSYKSYPRIVGETGGKDFILVHEGADIKAAATATIRGAFEYQGQKCSATSRLYVPKNKWAEMKQYLLEDISTIKMGTVEDFSNFVNAVIDEISFDNITKYIDAAKNSPDAEIIAGGTYDKTDGFFIAPTIILAKNPDYITLCDELFGPVLTVYVYDENKWDETLDVVNNTSPYALTGAIFSQDRGIINQASLRLLHSAGNFYINDKPSGAVVGQQPFGGARASGTNDKAGSYLNLIRWVSARTIKETFNPPKDYRYPFMG